MTASEFEEKVIQNKRMNSTSKGKKKILKDSRMKSLDNPEPSSEPLPSMQPNGTEESDGEVAFDFDLIVKEKNWYAEGKVTKPIQDQNGCGSCWAFTAASTLASLAAIKGIDHVVEDYSI